MNELVSIIVPVYNTEKYLSKCLNSILEQTYKNIEIILINDGSTDDSLKVCKEYEKKDKRIKLINKENEGLSATRNLGILTAKGKYIGFIDSDDFIESDMFNNLYEDMVNNNSDISICKITNSDEYLHENKKNEVKILNNKEAILKLLYDQEINNYVCNKLIKKEMFKNIKFPEGRKFEDLAIMHCLIEKAKTITFDDYIGYHYIQRKGSITKSITESYLTDYLWATDKFISTIKKNHKELANEIESTYAKYLVNIFSSCTKGKLRVFYNSEKMKQKYKTYKNICKDLGLKEALKKLNFKHKCFAILLFCNKKLAYFIGSKI